MANNLENSVNWSEAGTLTNTARFMRRVYGWMMLGVAMSGIVAYAYSENTTIAMTLAQSRSAVWGIFLAQMALVMELAHRPHSGTLAHAAQSQECHDRSQHWTEDVPCRWKWKSDLQN